MSADREQNHLDVMSDMVDTHYTPGAYASAPTLAKIICAWCQTVMQEGAEPVSHGICKTCYEQAVRS